MNYSRKRRYQRKDNIQMMTNTNATKPEATEYAPYYGRYVSLVQDGDILATLHAQLDETLTLLSNISESQAEMRYAPGKWSIKELIGHVIDTERIFGYRALRFARNDQTPLPGFEQDDYARNASVDDYPLRDLAGEFSYVRQSNLCLFRHLSPEAWQRSGTASGNQVSVRALAYIIAGHELHHRAILREKYL
jgi:uncharacterized damage-inducible protein DinB